MPVNAVFRNWTHFVVHGLIMSICLVVLLTLSLTGHTMNTNSPEKYFSGEYLTAARAIDAGDVGRLAAVTQGLNVDTPGRQHMTLLWYATQRKNYEAVTVLIKRGSRPDQQVVEGLGTPLYVALMNKETRLLKAMLDGGMSPDLPDEDGRTLLQQAMIGDKASDVVQLLISRNANVNLQDRIGRTPLNAAINSLRPEIGILLVEHGANVNTHLTNGSSPAWGVQQTIADLQPGSKQAPITNISPGRDGQPVSTTTVPSPPGATLEGQELLRKFEQLRALMIVKGAKFPADSPAQVREQIKRK
jgi:hypothetical protein